MVKRILSLTDIIPQGQVAYNGHTCKNEEGITSGTFAIREHQFDLHVPLLYFSAKHTASG
mgnify:CR=1 FL=1